MILRNEKQKNRQYEIDTLRDRAAIGRGRRATPPITHLRRPARCGRSPRVAPPSLRFPAEVMAASIEWPLVCGFVPSENFASTLLFDVWVSV